MKKYTFSFALLMTLATLPAHAQLDNLSSTSVLVCRAHQCADASYSMTRGFLFNKMAQMMEQNIGKTVLVCEADPYSHVCLNEGLTVPVTTPFSKSELVIQDLKLTDEKKLNGATGLDLVWDYRIGVDKIYPSCELALSRLNVNYTDKIELTTNDFLCHVTETGQTSLNATYNINYLDFDYGFIGAYYTIGVGGVVRGDKTGYALFRFTARPEKAKSVEPAQMLPSAEITEPSSLPLPEILKETAPATTSEAEPIRIEEKKEVLPPQQKPETTLKNPIRVVPQIIIQKPAEEPNPQPTVIKTTTIEKTVITSDGARQVTPPETRTFIDGIAQ